MSEPLNFPLYRKYSNEKSYFKILSGDEFIEYNTIGRFYSINQLKASILPDRNYIIDLIENKEGYYLSIEKQEFEETIALWEKEKTLLT